MKIELDLATAESIALRRFAADTGIEDLSIAAHFALTEYLISVGMLELPESDNESGG